MVSIATPFMILENGGSEPSIYSKDIVTPDRRQSKTILTIDERGSYIARNSIFDCHLSPVGPQMANLKQVGRQMAIENSVSSDFFYLRF